MRPPLPAPPYEGGCTCGAARYRITARPFAVNACHCLDCKRVSGVACGIFLHVPVPSFEPPAGAVTRFRRTAESGRHIDLVRCAACGSPLWHAPEAVPDLVLVAAGTLDDSRWAVPTSHIWTRTAGADAVYAGDALVFEMGAPDRQVLWDNFAKVYPAR